MTASPVGRGMHCLTDDHPYSHHDDSDDGYIQISDQSKHACRRQTRSMQPTDAIVAAFMNDQVNVNVEHPALVSATSSLVKETVAVLSLSDMTMFRI